MKFYSGNSRINKHFQSFVMCFVVAVIIPSLVTFCLMQFDEVTHRTLIRENGLIETLTVVLYIIAAVLLLIQLPKDWLFRVSSAFILFLMAARELDLHKAVIMDSIFKINTYKNSVISMGDKVVGVAAVLVIITAVLIYIFKYGSVFWRSLKFADVKTYYVLSVFLIAGLTKTLDGLHRHAHDLTGIVIKSETRLFISTMEEAWECVIPLLFILATLKGVREKPL